MAGKKRDPSPGDQKAPRHAGSGHAGSGYAGVVIIGGGIMGCGLAYHLAHEGWRDVVVLEKAELTSGSTWHAAGQITRATSDFGLGKCVDYAIGLYAGGLQAETGQDVTWHGCGSLRLAYTEDEMDWLRHTLSVGRGLGVAMELVDPEQVRNHHPFYALDGVIGALHTPDDGHVDPAGVTLALAAGARLKGVVIRRRCRATNITREKNGEWRIATDAGDIVCEHLVNAGGAYARQMGNWSGLQLPMTSMTHHYFVTGPVAQFADLAAELPVIRDDRQVSGYVRMEQQGGLIGIYEKENPNSVWEEGCPWEAENELFDPDYDRVMPWLKNALERMPVLESAGIRRAVHGAISHPPDGNPLIGPAPGAPNYWCCCGTQVGIGWGPGLTRELARWMVHGAADISMRAVDPRRFGDYADRPWQAIKAREDYCLRHEVPFPRFNRHAGRPVRPGPLYERLTQRGAIHEEICGHERPRWFAAEGMARADHHSFRRSIVDERVAAEVAAVRRGVGLMDISAFTKVDLSGPAAAALLDGLIANRLPKKPGGITLTHMVNRRGRIEMEVIVARLAPDRFYLVCAAFFEQRLLDHLEAHRPQDVTITNHSRDWGAVSLQGPKSRRVLAACTSAALDNTLFPWMTARTIEIAGHPMQALRLSYAGELGWEIHGAAAHMPAVYDALWEAGLSEGIANYGSFAMDVMRMEKAFKGAGELTNEVTLPEADVMRFVHMDKEFSGKEATQASLAGERRWLCAYLTIESDGVIDGHGGEAVLWGGRVAGATTSVAYSHTIGTTLAFAYLTPAAAAAGTALEAVIAGSARPARVLGAPAYDSDSLRPRMEAS